MVSFLEIQILWSIPIIIYYFVLGVVNGKSETHQDAETGVLKSEPKTKKCNVLIEK